MIPLTLHEVVTATAGRLVLPPGTSPAEAEALVVDGPVVTDSRLCGPGGLYVARAGEHADGHDFVGAAHAAGAVAALVQREVDVPVAQLVVDDTETAFGLLARDVVEAAEHDLTVVAVTGSSGKTSTKDLMAHVLAGLGPTVAAQESYNSEIGVPLTVCRTGPGTRYLVVEMGARGAGHLEYLCTIAPPDVSVVLNVGWAHAGEFGSVEAVQAAKSDLVQALTPEGTAVLNLDDHRVAAMREHADRVGARVVGTVSVAVSGAQVRADHVVLDDEGRASFELVSELPEASGRAPVSLGLHGEHHVANALSAAAVALLLGGTVEQVADLLTSARASSRWRMEVTHRADGVTVVNDAYNANPDSMRAALKALVQMRRPEGRTWAVLGGMLELGDESVRLHDDRPAGRPARRLPRRRRGGGRAADPHRRGDGGLVGGGVGVGRRRRRRPRLLRAELRAGDVVLLKSSRDSGLRWLGERVAADAAPAAATVDAVHEQGADAPSHPASGAEEGDR